MSRAVGWLAECRPPNDVGWPGRVVNRSFGHRAAVSVSAGGAEEVDYRWCAKQTLLDGGP